MAISYGKMEPSSRAAWLKALRSGEYEQGHGALNCGGKHCCLGVAADAVLKLDWKGTGIIVENGSELMSTYETIIITACSHLSSDQKLRMLLSDAAQRRLINMNDSERKSFGEIADWIEENL